MEERDKDAEPVVTDLDEVDGILKSLFWQGKYRPKQYETEEWGPDGPSGNGEVENDQCSLIGNLLCQQPEWRNGFTLMLRDLETETQVRKCMVFLHNLIKNAIETIENNEKSIGKSVTFEPNSAPSGINMSDWMSVMSGLNFYTESPGTVRNIDFVDVEIGPDTNKDVLMGFCHFLECVIGLSWTHLKIILNMDEENGKIIFTTVAMLDAGYGISDKVKAPLAQLESKYPSLLKTLGFISTDSKKLQWQKPFDYKEFDLVFGSLHGLFRPVEETVL